jgi:ubiquinone/menaquinone biosynthesis C-methylase UbiE
MPMARGAHPLFARYYARTSLTMERGIAGHRRTLLEGLSGRVIEVGAGNGLNFAHYPPGVTSVLAVEPEPLLRRIAQENAGHARVPVEVVDGTAEHLPVDDQSCDAAVTSLVLCTVPDPGKALAEVLRVIEPGGQLRFFEHVRSRSTARHRIQRLLDATVWPAFGGGCHTGRDTEAAITEAGFVIERLDRLSSAATSIPFPASPQILGIAVRPRPAARP